MAIRFRKNSNDTDVDCYRNLNLLAHAQMVELDIGSQCGGHGICGGDRVLLSLEDRKKVSPLSEAERKHLTAEEIQAGWRLGCQCWPESDQAEISVEVPGKL